VKIKLQLNNCPALMLHGSKEFLHNGPEKVKKLFAKARFASIENGQIDVTRVMPEEFAEEILDFLRERTDWFA
jgi:hypothetical protein